MRALLFFPAAFAACTCGTNLGPEDAGPADGGPVTISCSTQSDCPQDVPECSFGVCKRPCAANDGCVNPQTFCNQATGYCEAGCRDSSTCAGGNVCSAGACITSQGCATKCDCVAGQVCGGGACQDPPATCDGPDQCGRGADGDPCEDFQCNGFTHQCFDPSPTPCNSDPECTGRPGCAGGCTCTGNHQCVPGAACTAQNESTTCGGGNYCDGNGACQVLPPCTSDAACAGAGLTCNTAAGTCQRPRACTASPDCTVPPATFCNTTTGFCAQPLCNNGGVTCTGGQTCAPDGRCVTQGTGGPCTNDAACAATEYCALVGGNGQCAVGCRNNASCPNPGDLCDGTHTCVGGGGGLGQFGDSCTTDGDCQAGLQCGLFTGTCAEACGPSSSSCAGGACCTLSGQPCCNGFGFCASPFGGC